MRLHTKFHAGLGIDAVTVFEDGSVVLDFGAEGGEELTHVDDPLLTTKLDSIIEQARGFTRQVAWLREQVSTGAFTKRED